MFKNKLHEDLYRAIKTNNTELFISTIKQNEIRKELQLKHFLIAFEKAVTANTAKNRLAIKLIIACPLLLNCFSENMCQKLSHYIVDSYFHLPLVELLIQKETLQFTHHTLHCKLTIYIGLIDLTKLQEKLPLQPDKNWIEYSYKFAKKISTALQKTSPNYKNSLEIMKILKAKYNNLYKKNHQITQIKIPHGTQKTTNLKIHKDELFDNLKTKNMLNKFKPDYRAIQCNEKIKISGKQENFVEIITQFTKAKQFNYLDSYILRTTQVAFNNGIGKMISRRNYAEAIELYLLTIKLEIANDFITTSAKKAIHIGINSAIQKKDIQSIKNLYVKVEKLNIINKTMMQQIIILLQQNINKLNNYNTIVWSFSILHKYNSSNLALCNKICNKLPKNESRKIFTLFFQINHGSEHLPIIKNHDNSASCDLHGLDHRTTYHYLEFIMQNTKTSQTITFNVGAGNHSNNINKHGEHPVLAGIHDFCANYPYNCIRLLHKNNYQRIIKFIPINNNTPSKMHPISLLLLPSNIQRQLAKEQEKKERQNKTHKKIIGKITPRLRKL
ncbi:MAG: hypothetical protein PVI75_05380 [Gammaproteobacteria bacterium]|jgi:hypothetical protein